MRTKKTHHSNEDLEYIWDQVPPDYYQKGINNNLLQRLWHKRKLKAVLELIPKKPRTILDVGCASGWLLSEIAKRYPHVQCTGIDVYRKSIEYGKRRYKHLRLFCADAHNLPFPDHSFDLIVCTELLEHVIYPEKVLSEIKRVLKPQGFAIIEMDTGNFLFKVIWYWWTNLRKGVWKDAHIHSFNTKRLEELIIESNFKILNKKIFNFSMAVAFCLRKNEKGK